MIRIHSLDRFPAGLSSPDAYFLPGYGRAATAGEDGEWVLLEAFDGAWQMPLILRPLVDGIVVDGIEKVEEARDVEGARDAISPYGYSGVYASPALSSPQLKEAWTATIDALRSLRVISVLLRHSPLAPQAPDLIGLRSIISGHPTIVLEQTDNDSAWTGMESNCRNTTRKALKNGYTGEVRPATREDLASGSDFRRLYEQTMQRCAAAPAYFFSDEYYGALLAGLGSNLLICEVRSLAGTVVSSSLLMRHERRLHYHLSGSNVDDARRGSNNLMLWTAAQFAIAQGLGQFHLGGGVSARDGLFKFKRSFGGRELEYSVSGLITDHEHYQSHTENRAKACGISAETLSNSNFFPAYRGGTARA